MRALFDPVDGDLRWCWSGWFVSQFSWSSGLQRGWEPPLAWLPPPRSCRPVLLTPPSAVTRLSTAAAAHRATADAHTTTPPPPGAPAFGVLLGQCGGGTWLGGGYLGGSRFCEHLPPSVGLGIIQFPLLMDGRLPRTRPVYVMVTLRARHLGHPSQKAGAISEGRQ